jgi:hypothetical protein
MVLVSNRSLQLCFAAEVKVEDVYSFRVRFTRGRKIILRTLVLVYQHDFVCQLQSRCGTKSRYHRHGCWIQKAKDMLNRVGFEPTPFRTSDC